MDGKGKDADTSQVVSYASRVFTSFEERYSQTEKEALAIIWGIKHLNLYTHDSQFSLKTCHNVNSRPSARIER